MTEFVVTTKEKPRRGRADFSVHGPFYTKEQVEAYTTTRHDTTHRVWFLPGDGTPARENTGWLSLSSA